MTATRRPAMLEGLRIADMSTVVFGPYATQVLADLGAEVVKLEPPEGDTIRLVGTAAVTPGMSPLHLRLNRGKRSVDWDLKTAPGREAMRRLLATSDVFIHNVRGDAIARAGLDYDGVRAIRPDIVYVHCTGFDQRGPVCRPTTTSSRPPPASRRWRRTPASTAPKSRASWAWTGRRPEPVAVPSAPPQGRPCPSLQGPDERGLSVDAASMPLHRQQPQAPVSVHDDHDGRLPLEVFCGQDLLARVLRPSSRDPVSVLSPRWCLSRLPMKEPG